MTQDVYICYDENDQDVANKVCDVLEDNKLSCWMRSRDVSGEGIIKEMNKAISNSRVMVLIYSKFSKASNLVNTDTNKAFDKGMPVLIYKIDDSKIDGSFKFFVENAPAIDAHEDVEAKFSDLVNKTSQLVSQQKSKERKLSYIIKKHKKPIIIGVALVLIVIMGIFAYMTFSQQASEANTIPLNAGDVKIKITDFHVDDVRKKGYSWNYSYFVGGIITPEPVGNYIITCDFYDESGNLVNTTETPVSSIQRINDGYLLGSSVSGTKNIVRVEVQLVDSNNIVIAQCESEL